VTKGYHTKITVEPCIMILHNNDKAEWNS